MKRKEFITLLGVGAGTVVVASCIGGCGKGGESTPNPNPNPDPTLPVLTINNVSTNADLNNPNKAYIIQNGVIVAKTGENSYVALGGACTHAGSSLTFNGTSFPCSLQGAGHGSVFNLNGSVKTGPAQTALKNYTYTLENDTLKVFA